jgi:hypothetical protein
VLRFRTQTSARVEIPFHRIKKDLTRFGDGAGLRLGRDVRSGAHRRRSSTQRFQCAEPHQRRFGYRSRATVARQRRKMTMVYREHDINNVFSRSCLGSRTPDARPPRRGQEREATARLIALLGEVDARKLYLHQGCASLFTYCVQVLHLSEHAAYLRIEAARAARAFPLILERLAEGALHLTAISLIAPHLTPANHREILGAACHRSRREVDQLVACLRPRPDVPAVVRKLPAPKPVPRTKTSQTPREPSADDSPDTARPVTTLTTRPPEVKPLAPERYKVQFTVSRATYDKLRQVQDLLRHTIPDGDPAAIFDRALTLLLAEVSKTKLTATGDRGGAGRRGPSPATFLLQSSVTCGAAMADGAHSRAKSADARKPAFSSSIMSRPTWKVA